MPLGDHTLIISLEGDLWAFGCNEEGQLGLGHRNDQHQPAKVPWNGSHLVQVDWGRGHSLVLDVDGSVWETGNSRPFLQQVQGLPCITLVAAGGRHSAAIDSEGGLWVWASHTYLSWVSTLPQRVEGLPPLLKVACGWDSLVVEAKEGTLWGLGDNSQGQLGLGHTNSTSEPTLIHVEDLSEGPLRCLAAQQSGVLLIDSQGGMFSAGNSSYCQLGRDIPSGELDSKLQRIMNIPPMVAVCGGAIHGLSLDENGAVWSWGLCGHGSLGISVPGGIQPHPALVPSLKEISAIISGHLHSLAFPQEGGLLVFGENDHGQLGLHHVPRQFTPTLCPVQPALPHSPEAKGRLP